MQYYKIICVCLLLSTCSISAYAQDEAKERFKQFTLSFQPEYSRQEQTISLQHFETAYGWSRHKNRMFEVGLSNVAASTRKSYWYNQERLEIPTRNIHRSIGLNAAQYLYLRRADTYLQPYIAAGWAMLLENHKNIPGTLSGGNKVWYPSKDFKWNNNFFLSPGIQYRFSNLLIKIEIPVSIVQTGIRHQRIENPNIPTYSRQRTQFNLDVFPFEVIALELGIAYRINQ